MPGTLQTRIFAVISLAFLLVQCSVSQNFYAHDTANAAAQQGKDTLSAHTPAFQPIKDSLIRVRPIPLIGALEPFGDSSEAILDSQIPWIEYRYIGDLLWTKPGMYIRDMGSPGQHNELTIGGVDERGIAFLVDGRSQADPITGTYDMILFPTDYIERIEFITGPRAMLYGMNSTGGTINIVTKSFYTNKPYSRLRYSQGVDDYTQTDAIFSQNIFSRFNFTFGLERHALGFNQISQDYSGRFVNSDYDAWSFRTKLRYDISNSFNIVFSHLYEQAITGLNDGVDYTNTPSGYDFDEQNALVSNNEAYEKIYNHHLDLTAAAHLTGDTMQVTTLTTYYSNQLREYRDEARDYPDGLPFNGVLTHSDNRSSNAGILLRNELASSAQNFSVAVQAEEIQVESSPEVGGHKVNKFSASAKEEVLLLSPLTFAVFGRTDNYLGRNLPGAGADAQIAINSSLSFFGGMSVSHRTPTLQELYWSSDSTHVPTPRLWLKDEQHTLIQVGARFSVFDFLSGTISLNHREIKNPILVDTTVAAGASASGYSLEFLQPALNVYNGVDVSLKATYSHFYAEGNATYLKQPDYYHVSDKLTLLPELYFDGSFYYKNQLVDGHLDLKIGFRGRYTSKQSGMAPLNESGLYVPYELLESFGPSGTADFFLIAKLGDAYLHLIWENLSGNQYMLTPFYPMYARNVRFGVSWEFWN
jgi:outer membrane cobalamin receptor